MWKKDSLFYLGVHITLNQKKLYDLNYASLMAGLRGDLKKWTGKYLTWFGRVSAIKMCILPRIIYMLHTVPIKLPGSFFKQIRKAFVAFVWNSKQPRLTYDILRRSKADGGMGLPDILVCRWFESCIGATTPLVKCGSH